MWRTAIASAQNWPLTGLGNGCGLSGLVVWLWPLFEQSTLSSRWAIMAESFGTELTIVEVTTDDLLRPEKQLWVAAAKPNQAVTLVLTEVPEGWIADVATGHLTRKDLETLRNLRLNPGEVRKLTK